jgi:hypothetical protein
LANLELSNINQQPIQSLDFKPHASPPQKKTHTHSTLVSMIPQNASKIQQQINIKSIKPQQKNLTPVIISTISNPIQPQNENLNT